MDLFIADTHFGHQNILSERLSVFSDLEDMNRRLVENINARMKRSDTLYIIGDFAYRSKTPPMEILASIKPKKILITGNHDRDWLRHLSEEDKAGCFKGIYTQYSIKKNGIELHLNHFPLLAWNRSHFFGQSFSICGHIHARRHETVAAELFPYVKCQFNAGVDVNGYQPVTFAELVRNNTAFYQRSYTEEEQALLDEAIQRIMT